MSKQENDQKVYEYILQTVEQMGYPPAIREICTAVGIASPSTVHGCIKRLKEQGLIEQEGTKKRALRVPHLQNTAFVQSVPVVGKVAAGTPILATENITETLPVAEGFFGRGELFMLKVQGNSMINAGILDGDYVVVRRQNTCKNGEMAVALIDDSATVKTFYKEKDHIRLQPENDAMEPICVTEVVILGVVTGVIRSI